MKLFSRTIFMRAVAGMVPIAAAVILLADSGPLTVKFRDDCDPTTFNQAIGPGTCVGNGDTAFQEFSERTRERRTGGGLAHESGPHQGGRGNFSDTE
jgi:hypothetical protein